MKSINNCCVISQEFIQFNVIFIPVEVFARVSDMLSKKLSAAYLLTFLFSINKEKYFINFIKSNLDLQNTLCYKSIICIYTLLQKLVGYLK